jgi:two-component system, NarL family, captular synthesis response regulator RcsB
MPNPTIKLIIADDHPATLAGIEHALAGIHQFDIVGTASNSAEIIGFLGKMSCDILITDYAMPYGVHKDGVGLLSFLRRRYPALKIIVFSLIDNPTIGKEIFKLGVKAVLSKGGGMIYLIHAIHAAYRGATYESPDVIERTLQSRHVRATSNRTLQLSRRESEVIRLYLTGRSITEIAREFNRSKQTISAQKSSAMRKLGVDRDADLFRLDHERGLITSGGLADDSPFSGSNET